MQHMAIQPLDLLPPVDVTFRDYALAVLRAEEIANPTDPDDYRGMMLDVFVKRGILGEADRTALRKPHHVFDRLDLDVFHDVDTLASSRADAYRFLDDNRSKLFIPWNADVTVADLCTAHKLTRQARRLPEADAPAVHLARGRGTRGRRVRAVRGRDHEPAVRGHARARSERRAAGVGAQARLATDRRQPGSALKSRRKARRGGRLPGRAGQTRQEPGASARRSAATKGLLAKHPPPLTSRIVDGIVRFELSPHFGIHDDGDDLQGGRAWQISS